MIKSVIVASVLTLSTSIYHQAAAKGPAPDCNVARPCIFDSHNKFVGYATAEDILLRPIGTSEFYLEFDDQGLSVDGIFYYADSKCMSPPLLDIGTIDTNNVIRQFLLPSAVFDGTAIWGPTGNAAKVAIAAYKFPTTTSLCMSLGNTLQPTPLAVRQAAIIETPVFSPPLHPVFCEPGECN
jgi:hypothetical protein